MKNIVGIALSAAVLSSAWAQSEKPDMHWYHSAPSKTNMGISLDEAYQMGLPAKKQIIVAVVDGGTDVNHEDLNEVLWTNPGEIAGNGIDDDGNGYIDDIHGWNFIGGADGRNVGGDNMEKVRLYAKLRKQFENLEAEDVNSQDYLVYQELKMDIEKDRARYEKVMERMSVLQETMAMIQEKTGKEDPSAEEVSAVELDSAANNMMVMVISMAMNKGGESFSSLKGQIDGQVDQVSNMLNYHYNPDLNTREIVGDDYNNPWERHYGNADVIGPDAGHGTHVAGIIAGKRGNNIGMDGVCDAAQIMVVRVVPDGDERDKDVANGIIYAVDNGAQIINMSFGKGTNWYKPCVDSAVAYALRKGVLLVHAAGNDGANNDIVPKYPNDSLNGGFASNWIEIGASQIDAKHLATSFSNYGVANVDVFSPGRDIYSSIPNNEYAYFNGTSMAAPCAAGVAALVWSRYPNLTAQQVKACLMEGSVPVKGKVILPGTDKQKVKLKDICVSGGLVNAKKALEMAATL